MKVHVNLEAPRGQTKVFWLALLMDATLVALHLVVPVLAGQVVGFFNLGAERNLPTWWSSGQLAWAGILFALVGERQRQLGSKWVLLGLFSGLLLAMSIDEFSGIHERIGYWLDGVTRLHSSFSVTGYWFIFLGIPVALAVGMLLLSLREQFQDVPFMLARLVLGFVVLFSGALVAEALSNFVEKGSALDRLQVALEEGLEMVGGTILLWMGVVFLVTHPSLPGVADALSISPLPDAHSNSVRGHSSRTDA